MLEPLTRYTRLWQFFKLQVLSGDETGLSFSFVCFSKWGGPLDALGLIIMKNVWINSQQESLQDVGGSQNYACALKGKPEPQNSRSKP